MDYNQKMLVGKGVQNPSSHPDPRMRWVPSDMKQFMNPPEEKRDTIPPLAYSGLSNSQGRATDDVA